MSIESSMTLTKFEVCQTVLADNSRSADDRAKAIALLKRIAEDVADPDCAEARRLLATLPLSQEAEDDMILKVLDFKAPNPYRPAIYPDFNYEPRLKDLIVALRTDPIFITDWHRQPGYAAQCVADLKALYERSKSDRVRAAVVEQLQRLAKWHTAEAIRAASCKALIDIGHEAETN